MPEDGDGACTITSEDTSGSNGDGGVTERRVQGDEGATRPLLMGGEAIGRLDIETLRELDDGVGDKSCFVSCSGAGGCAFGSFELAFNSDFA